MSNNKKKSAFETRAVKTGHVPEDGTNSVTTPIYPSSTFKVKYPGDDSGYVYSRWSNPTRSALERGIADLEEGTAAYAYSSGLSAVDAVINLLNAGDHIVASKDLYGGTHRLFENLKKKNLNFQFSYVEGVDPLDFEKAAKDNTRLFWLETPSNPLLRVIDIQAVVEIARKRKNILVGVDNTFATAYLQKPLTLGADIVHNSASKYLGGHCDLIGGLLAVKDEKLAEQLYFNQYAVGGHLGPFDSWLILRGLKTLHLRMKQHCENAHKIVAYLKEEELVDKIYFPGIDGKPLANNMKDSGGMVSFELKADFETVKQFAMATEVFILAESLGGVESLMNHPASMTHASIPKEIREANGIKDQLIRLSVGIEHSDDQIEDLKMAFNAIRSKVKV